MSYHRGEKVRNTKTFTIFLTIFFIATMLLVMFALIVHFAGDQQPAQSSACQPASIAQVEWIRSGIKSEATYNDLGPAFAVQSDDFEQVHFVAAQITGPELDGIVGVWAISGTPDKPGLIYSVNGYAHQFSGYGLGSATDAGITMDDHGAQQAYECAK